MAIESSVVFLPVSDIQKTYGFYHDILKLPVYQKQGESLYIFDTGYGYWGFCEYDDDRKPLSGPTGVCLSLTVASNEAVLHKYEELKDSVRIYKKPSMHAKYPVYSFFMLDPDDYLVEIQKIAK